MNHTPRTLAAGTFVMTLGAILTLGGAAHADPVALVNPGFEDADLGPWATSGAVHEVTRDAPHAGFRALRLGLAGTGTTPESAAAYQDVALTGSGPAATNVRISAAIVVDADLADDATASVTIEIYKTINATKVAVGTSTAFAAPEAIGGWASFEACATAPAGFEVFVRPSVTLTSASGKGTGAIRIDDVTLTAGDDAVCATPAPPDDGGCAAGGPAGLGLALLALLAAPAARRRAPRPLGPR